ncbi:hypothetical protein [Saccharibacter floricola]|uniref:Uncharacterized protein n=1 Tax=Saccharibacter floricola DSM 15669 TaxID=1123227 RepID=A0ABQ0NWF5_9PROT|nr:hypothetical protein [Saccharibacter floricola]GBQ04982.1 hypothetical protein AA15669_0249 [Saccharibacter floricola DSM 15669]
MAQTLDWNPPEFLKDWALNGNQSVLGRNTASEIEEQNATLQKCLNNLDHTSVQPGAVECLEKAIAQGEKTLKARRYLDEHYGVDSVYRVGTVCADRLPSKEEAAQ